MMTEIKLLNKIGKAGIDRFDGAKYTLSEDAASPAGILVRSAAMHEMTFGPELLAIARAAIADPPVLILDEATSSIDTRTERLIEKGMDSLMEGRTVFVIAHRLSTVCNADAIMVLDHGRIIERGSHDELIARKGTYYQLYTGMFELS